jgi:dynactin 1
MPSESHSDYLVAKFQDIQSSLLAAQRQSRDLTSENAFLEIRAAEVLEQLEMATLDREVAEEKAEAAETEVGKLGEKISELEVEVAVLKEENGMPQACTTGFTS